MLIDVIKTGKKDNTKKNQTLPIDLSRKLHEHASGEFYPSQGQFNYSSRSTYNLSIKLYCKFCVLNKYSHAHKMRMAQPNGTITVLLLLSIIPFWGQITASFFANYNSTYQLKWTVKMSNTNTSFLWLYLITLTSRTKN